MPALFAYTGVRTQIGLLTHWTDWLICGLIILAATVGKFGGTVIAARFSGLNWRTSASLGALMNTRRADGIDRAQHRAGLGCDFAAAVHDDGADGIGDDLCHDTGGERAGCAERRDGRELIAVLFCFWCGRGWIGRR